MRITILGCGAASGVPSVYNGWGKCDPTNPKNHRRRSSILVEEGPASVLFDTSPDLREQMLAARIGRLDGVVYTHAHADHIHGIDELRETCRVMQGPLPVYATAETLSVLETRFGYAFKGIPPGKPVFRPWLVPHQIMPTEAFTVGGITMMPFLQDHGYSSTTGFRFRDVVYSTDLIGLPEDSKAYIRNAKVWIIGVLSDAPYPTHVHLEKALEWISELKPQRAYSAPGVLTSRNCISMIWITIFIRKLRSIMAS